jgi:Fe-S cluster biosynthesis and repair protein YggX
MRKIGGSTIKLDSFTDESWEEISNRLINELKQEMMNAELSDEEEFDSATEQPGSDQAFFEPSNDAYPLGKTVKMADDRTGKTSGSSSSNTDDRAIGTIDEYEVQEQRLTINDSPTKSIASYLLKASSNDPTNVSSSDTKRLPSGLKALGISNGSELLKVIEICDPNAEQRKLDLIALIQSFASQTGANGSSYELIEKVLHNYNVDLEEITKQVLLNNERLLKLKGKHLRNYFRRQLDHSSSSDGNVS